jgi:acyl-homoserine lactone synthase
MIHVVTAANRSLYEPQLLQMHRQRTEIFVKGRGWSLKVAENGGEYDEGDDERALYFLALGRAGDIERSIRVRPTDDWCLLADVFPQFVGPDVPSVRNPDVWEMARYYATGAAGEEDGLGRSGELRLAMMEKAARSGIARIVGLGDLALMEAVIRTGRSLRALGPPGHYPEGEGIAVEIVVSPAALDAIRKRLTYRGTSILELAPGDALAEIGPKAAEVLLDASRRLGPGSLERVTRLMRAIARIEAASGSEAAIRAIERAGAAMGLDG